MKTNKEKNIFSMSLADAEYRDAKGIPRYRQQDSSCEQVDHPKHYNKGKYETIDVIEDWDLDFHCGNALKYISRHKHKNNPGEDIKKAIWYLERYLENLR